MSFMNAFHIGFYILMSFCANMAFAFCAKTFTPERFIVKKNVAIFGTEILSVVVCLVGLAG